MFVVCTPEQSESLHDELIRIEEEMFEDLGLHFLTLDMPADDLGAPAYRKVRDHSLTHSLAHSLTYSLTHSLAHSLTHSSSTSRRGCPA